MAASASRQRGVLPPGGALALTNSSSQQDKASTNPNTDRSRRVRPLTEARKTQNRLAQRAYRERQKAKLEASKSKNADDNSNAQEQEPTAPAFAGMGNEPQVQATLDTSLVPDSNDLEGFQFSGFDDSAIFSDLIVSSPAGDQLKEGFSLPSTTQPRAPGLNAVLGSISTFDSAITPVPDPEPAIDAAVISSTPFEDHHHARSVFTTHDPRSSLGDVMSTDTPTFSYSNDANVSLTTTRRRPSPSLNKPGWSASRRRQAPQTRDRQDFDFQQLNILAAICETLQIDGIDENYDLLKHAIIDQNISLGELLSAGLRSVLGGTRSTSPVLLRRALSLPDPKANTLRFVRASTLTSYLFNARAIGIPIHSLVLWDVPSPFHQPNLPSSADPVAIQASYSKPITVPDDDDYYVRFLHVSGTRNASGVGRGGRKTKTITIPPHLRPTLPQILYPHHPYLDLLPFSSLRARAISLGATTPPMYDFLELKHDVMRDGLICWRTRESGASGGGGVTHGGPGDGRYRGIGTGGTGNGEPWDMRNWEVAAWFAEKWRMLVGGEDEEPWKQSRWWRKMRGESEDIGTDQSYFPSGELLTTTDTSTTGDFLVGGSGRGGSGEGGGRLGGSTAAAAAATRSRDPEAELQAFSEWGDLRREAIELGRVKGGPNGDLRAFERHFEEIMQNTSGELRNTEREREQEAVI